MLIYKTCPLTDEEESLWVPGATREGFELWESGVLIQDAMPELSAEEREFIISGIPPHRQHIIFDEDE